MPQLHVHVIARFTDDPAWPKAVWRHRAAGALCGRRAAAESDELSAGTHRSLAGIDEGRICLTSAAKRRFTVEDHGAGHGGVEGAARTPASSTQTPAAYKDIDAVMAAQSDLVEVVHTLKQVLCVKG